MRLLILGGTRYLGVHTVEAAVARGHEVTLFNRGQSGPELFPALEHVRGDRDTDLGQLDGRSWDAVIDPSGYLPRQVRASAEALGPRIGHYVFVSSISVYAEHSKPRITEDDAVASLPEGAPEELSGETYGALKARCERTLGELLPGRLAVVRAGLIFGARDQTERTQYWTLRVARGGEVLAPGRPERPIQFVDVRDLAEWLVRVAERRVAGTFNATGPEAPLPMGQFLDACRAVSGSDASFTWVDEAFLLERGVVPYSELPLWVPEQYQGFATVDCRRAIAAGLAFRPLEDTVRAALEWARRLPPGPRPARAGIAIPPGLPPEREAELLREWHRIAADFPPVP